MCLLKMVARCDYFLEKSYPCKVWRLIYNLHASLRQTPGILRCTMLNIYIFIWNWLDSNILNRFQKCLWLCYLTFQHPAWLENQLQIWKVLDKYQEVWTHSMPLVSFYIPWKDQKTLAQKETSGMKLVNEEELCPYRHYTCKCSGVIFFYGSMDPLMFYRLRNFRRHFEVYHYMLKCILLSHLKNHILSTRNILVRSSVYILK